MYVYIYIYIYKVREFMEKAAKLISAHYPERSYKIMIINAPWWVLYEYDEMCLCCSACNECGTWPSFTVCLDLSVMVNG